MPPVAAASTALSRRSVDQPPAATTGATQTEHKKASHRSGKPIINWIQRKLGGGSSLAKSKRAENQKPVDSTPRPTSIPLRVTNRISSAPLPAPGTKNLKKLEIARRKTISLNEEEDGEMYANDLASEHSSLAHNSAWSPSSVLEADEDASMRPIPPSAPPSPSPSSSSYVSDPRTFRSVAASTKPTTLLSIDLNGNGMAHIAQAPANPINRLHVRSSSTTAPPAVVGSGASISFSALPPSPVSASQDGSARNQTTSNLSSSQTTPHGNGTVSSVQAPLHTAHHPRNNPRPSSPPLDNASVLTLASSAYAIPGRTGGNGPGWSSAPPSALNESLSHFGGSITYADAESTSQYLLGEDDVDASVRALRPRSSRRGSWESEASRWSARVQQGGAGTPSLARDGRSLWTSNSIRTGGFSAENVEMYEKSDEGDVGNADERSDTDGISHHSVKTAPDPLDVDQSHILSPKSDSEPTPTNALTIDTDTEAHEVSQGVAVDHTPASAAETKVPAAEASSKVEEYDDETPNEHTKPLA
ncbi:hypothetical protein C8J57DRAFT_1432822 [Mycena rebaudengoi]|nr:hypothetical protein C8J57DRAFT_1432822 [Mycena rebaudengoi]